MENFEKKYTALSWTFLEKRKRTNVEDVDHRRHGHNLVEADLKGQSSCGRSNDGSIQPVVPKRHGMALHGTFIFTLTVYFVLIERAT